MTRLEEYINPEDGLRYCQHCHTPRETVVTVQGHTFQPRALCKCQQEAVAVAKAQDKQLAFLDYIKRLPTSKLQDKNLKNYRFDRDNGRNPQLAHAHTYVERWADMAEKGQGLLLWGNVGTGKSFFAGCIANRLLEQGIPSLMTTTGKIINALTGLYSQEKNQLIDSLQRYDLLILDDLGMERTTEFVTEQLFHIIDSRYRSGKPMIITTNLSLEALTNPPDMAQKRIYSRILERCIPLKINGTNIREVNQMANMEQAKMEFRR